MIKKIFLVVAGFFCLLVLSLYIRSLPLLRRLPSQKKVSLDGITTLEEAVAACRRSGLTGWELVEYAQKLVARKMTYSRLNSWDTPSRAFERGMGYCLHSSQALHKIYRKLGIDSTPVHAFKCRFKPEIVDGLPSVVEESGHTWLRVRVGNEVKDVCPGSLNNRPGVIDFEIVSKVYRFGIPMVMLTYLGSVHYNIERDKAALKLEKNRTTGTL